MRFEGFFASFSPSLDPVAHRSLAYSLSHGYIFLLPAFLFQFPRAFSSFFSPIGFLWCSHASYRITLDFLLPMSVAIVIMVHQVHPILLLAKWSRCFPKHWHIHIRELSSGTVTMIPWHLITLHSTGMI